MSDSLQRHRLQPARLPCPSLSPGVCASSCPLNQKCYLNVSSSATFLVSSVFPSIRVFSNKLALPSHGNSVGVSASASILPMNVPGCFHFGLTGLISLQSKELSSLLQHHSLKVSIFWCSAFFMVQLSHPHVTTEKTIPLDYKDLCQQSNVSVSEYAV